ncbi:restriction endonuclease subunit S [Pseudoalteromonas sp. JB197]|uniref:restriction endonuclease subunit S n=1 Tax=Pseudoalteromonas sp. JB197 TaxID=1434839 RepID=UPI000B34E7EB|nr:restriction endonuclease subunit S [Pseudoalteromonas sp. JB197]PCC10281.1 restriction endonuclease subunit S [Pseudoalteromonas sp. JB197]
MHDDFWPLNTTLWIKEYRKSNPYHAFHLLSTLGLEQFNSGSAVPTLNRNHIHSLPLVVPTILVLNEYESYVEGLFLKIRKNNNQSKTLKNLRDTLLPKLISGELQIPDVASDEEVVD